MSDVPCDASIAISAVMSFVDTVVPVSRSMAGKYIELLILVDIVASP